MNFLTIAVDDLNAFATFKALYPGELHTPNIDRLMADGVTFQNAFAQIALCNPSRTSILTGQYPGETGVHSNAQYWADYVGVEQTLPAIMKVHGYYTGIFGKIFHAPLARLPEDQQNALADASMRTGEYLVLPGETTEIDDGGPLPEYGPLNISDAEHGDFINTQAAIDFLAAASPDQPFNIFAGIFKPHTNWKVPQEYFDLYPIESVKLPAHIPGDRLDMPAYVQQVIASDTAAQVVESGQWEEALQAYFASVSFADAMVGRLLDAVEATGHADDTAIILWSDHGYHLGDKDTWHKFTLWEEAGRAPLIFKIPGSVHAGAVVTQPVELVDIAPTMLELASISPPETFSGTSLVPFLLDPSHISGQAATTSMFGSASLRTDAMRYIRYRDGSEELYDLQHDLHEWTNLASDPAYADALGLLREQLDTTLGAQGWHWLDQQDRTGTDGNDILVVMPAHLEVSGGPGDDQYFVEGNGVLIMENDGGGIDTVYTDTSFVLPEHVENLHGVWGAGVELDGNSQANIIWGGQVMRGMDGDDILFAQKAARLYGGPGNDILNGLREADFLDGGEGDDIHNGGNGDDTIVWSSGNDTIIGAGGVNLLDYSNSPEQIFVNLPEKSVVVANEVDFVTGIHNVIGTDKDDTFIMNPQDNVIWLGLGSDTVDGRAGVDTVVFPAGVQLQDITASKTARNSLLSYELDGVTYAVTLTNVEQVAFGDGTTQLLEQVLVPAHATLDMP